MAFKTLKTKREVISLTELDKQIAAQRLAVGEVCVSQNAGTRRTETKKALLAQIAKVGGNW
ncbi:MAG TPA: hypothetical protein VF503_15720 [Sphingobium sp.]|uniref:hypothetical protein n=1 Tax=Sphingobium sp. TaxID=1912891 RepID=UPI002ED4D8D4